MGSMEPEEARHPHPFLNTHSPFPGLPDPPAHAGGRFIPNASLSIDQNEIIGYPGGQNNVFPETKWGSGFSSNWV